MRIVPNEREASCDLTKCGNEDKDDLGWSDGFKGRTADPLHTVVTQQALNDEIGSTIRFTKAN
jgi:hypothetical protein